MSEHAKYTWRIVNQEMIVITKTCPCNITYMYKQYFSALQKTKISVEKKR